MVNKAQHPVDHKFLKDVMLSPSVHTGRGMTITPIYDSDYYHDAPPMHTATSGTTCLLHMHQQESSNP
jgi:hypothetical protein